MYPMKPPTLELPETEPEARELVMLPVVLK